MPSSLFLLSLFGLLLIFVLFYQFAFNHSRNVNRKKNISYAFLLCFFIYSFYTLTKLVTSTASEQYFTNSDYHHIEHIGFSSLGNTLNLAGENKDVLNENFNGSLQIVKDLNGEMNFQTAQFNYPIYEFDNLYGEKKIINIDEIGVPFENTFTIELPNKVIVYKAEKYNDSVCHKIIINGVEDVVKYNKKEINISQPFQELIYNTAAKGLTQNEIELLEESFIVRESFTKPSDYGNLPYGNGAFAKFISFFKSKPNHSKLYFVPNPKLKLYAITSDLSTRSKVLDCTKKFPIIKGHKFVFGFLGYNDEKPFKVDIDKQSNIEITYLYPRKYKLNNSIDKEERQFILSSWTGLKNNRLETGYLLDSNVPDSSGYNIASNHSNIISFKSGNGNEKLEIKNLFAENNKWEATNINTLHYLKSANNKLNWILKIENTKNNHFLKIPIMIGILVSFIVFILYLFNQFSFIQFDNNRVRREKSNVANSILLYVIFFNILIYLLVLIKIFLIWRIATFPPLDIVSLMDMSAFIEYNNLSNPTTSIFYLIGFLILLMLLEYLFLFKYNKVKVVIEKIDSFYTKKLAINIIGDNYINICFKLFSRNFTLILILIILNVFINSPLINLLSTLIIFFTNQLFVLNNKNLIYTSNINNEFKRTYSIENKRYPIFNYIFFIPLIPIFLFLAVKDAGFLYVFIIGILIYKLFSAIFLLYGNTTHSKTILRKLFITGIILAVLLVFPAKIAILTFVLFEKYYYLASSLIVLISAILVCYYYIDTYPLKLRKRNKLSQVKLFIIDTYKKRASLKFKNISMNLRMFGPILLIFLSSLLFFFKPMVLSQLNNKNHIRFRAEVIDKNSESISKLSGETNYKSYSFRSLTQQYQNKWFIEHFINRAYSQVDKDFTIQNHLNKGSGYTIQTRDTIIPRYIIGEHNRFIPFVLALIMLLIIAFNFFVFPHRIYTSSGKIITLCMSLLFAMMLFVTLTSTNLIPFFGQDFPILPTTSKVALGFPLLILAFCLYIHVSKTSEIVEYININVKTGGILLGVILLFVAPILLLLNKKSVPPEYSLLKTEEVNKMKAEIEVFNNDIDSFYNNNKIYSDVHRFHKEYTRFLEDRIDIKDIFIENFSRKAYENFDENADKLNTKSIYYYANINGKYRLEVNPNFDKINFTQDEMWKGDIVSGSVNKISVNVFDLNYKKDSIYFFDKNEIQKFELDDHFSLTHIPSSLTNNASGYYILSSPSTRYLKLKENSNSLAKTNYVRCKSGDEVGKIISAEPVKWMGVAINENIGPNVVMKNYKVNNVRYYYYPKDNELTWAKNYASYINNLIKHNDNIPKDSTFEVCVDLQLNHDLKTQLSYLSEGSSIAIVNNLGEIITIADNNKKNINPNDRKALTRFSDKISLRRNSKSERDAYGNYALLNMITGPASSQKPLTYAAVASQLKIDWSNLNYQYNNVDNRIIKDNQLLQYAGIDIRQNKKKNIGFLLSSHDMIPSVNYDSYLYNSVNMYHSMICYLGLYEKEKYITASPFERVSSTKNIFPLINYQSNLYTFNSKNRPLFDDYKSLERSFLNQGYLKNFGFESRLANEGSIKYDGFALPEVSRIESKIQSYSKSNAIKFTTLGSPKIWRVSPVAMALAYTKLFTLNNTINGTFLNSKNAKEAFFDIDTMSDQVKWNSTSEYFNFIKNNVFTPMSHVVTSGTLKYIPIPSNGYHLYAKTGTINEGAVSNEDKLLVLIISKGKVEEFTTLNQLRENKFWTVYFSLPKGQSDFSSNILRAYDTIIKSEAFKKYMQL